MANLFGNTLDAVRIVRELKLLRLLKHVDMVDMTHVILPADRYNFDTIDMVFEHMDTDLHIANHLNNHDSMSSEHYTVILYQILRGLTFMHACGVLHRDIKPKNILIRSNCKIKIADLGLSRPKWVGEDPVEWSDYIATRWYRAPEICGCSFGHYSESIDVWAVGCIYAELMLKRALFPGSDVLDQLQRIVSLLGTPSHETIMKVQNEMARQVLMWCIPQSTAPFEVIFPNATGLELDMLRGLLAFDPDKRFTCAEALAHPLFEHMPEVAVDVSLDFIEQISKECAYDMTTMSAEEVRELLYKEALLYNS